MAELPEHDEAVAALPSRLPVNFVAVKLPLASNLNLISLYVALELSKVLFNPITNSPTS